jgi:hypothetical protein
MTTLIPQSLTQAPQWWAIGIVFFKINIFHIYLIPNEPNLIIHPFNHPFNPQWAQLSTTTIVHYSVMFIMFIVKIHWIKGWHWNWEKWAESAFNGCSWASALCDETQHDANFGTSPGPSGSDLTKIITVGIRMVFNKKYFKVAAMKIAQKKGLDVFS